MSINSFCSPALLERSIKSPQACNQMKEGLKLNGLLRISNTQVRHPEILSVPSKLDGSYPRPHRAQLTPVRYLHLIK